jgi:colicin import membrane protein
MRAELAAEQAARDAAQRKDLEAAYKSAVERAVTPYWIRPPAADNLGHFTCKLLITQNPDGQVTDVKLVSSCGDPVVDRSVEQAVRRASPLPPPPPELVSEARELPFTFRR